MEDILNGISQCLVFSKLNRSDQVELLKLARQKKVLRGETLCWQGDVWPFVAYVVRGGLEWTMLSPDGKRQVVFSLGPGQLAWGHSCLDNQSMPANLEVADDGNILLWPGETIIPLISRNTGAVWDVSRLMLSYMRSVREKVYGFAFQPVAGRLASLLIEYYKPKHGHATQRELTLDQMADKIGTTRELISRTLHKFANEGLIKINRVEIIFTDTQGLEDIAGK